MICAVLLLVVPLLQLCNGSQHHVQEGKPMHVVSTSKSPVVLITTIDPVSGEELRSMVMENRRGYASQHGYEVFLPNVTDYPLNELNMPTSWSKIPAVRHAMTLYPHSTFFFYLDASAIITNPTLSLHTHITEKTRLESLMIPDQPVVPPDSVIRTLRGRKADHVDFIVTQDHEGISQASFILRRGEWAKFFLDSWYDPLYRAYNFQRAEGHALEHLVQWHGTVLGRMALVPQTVMNSYAGAKPLEKEQYQDGHFVANVHDCGAENQPHCENIMRPYYEAYQRLSLAAPARGMY